MNYYNQIKVKKLNDTYLKCVLTLDHDFCDDYKELAAKSAYWL